MEDALQKIARGLIALGWLFAVVASSYILSQSTNMNDNNVEYTIGLNHSSSSTRSYELVIGAPPTSIAIWIHHKQLSELFDPPS